MARNQRHVPREDRVSRILVCATEAFAEKGYEAATIAGIAKSAGLAPSAVLWYFPSKDELFAAVIDQLIDDLQAEVAERLVDDDASNLTTIFEVIEQYRPFHGVVMVRMSESEHIKSVYGRVHEWVDEAFLKAIQPHFRQMADPGLVKELIRIVIDGNSGSDRGNKSFSEVVSFLINDVLTRRDSTLPSGP